MDNNQLKDIINFAIKQEIKSSEFYNKVSKKITTDLNLKKTFEEYAIEELKHKKFLEDFLEGDIHDFSIPNVTDYHVSETAEKPKISTEMKFVDVVTLAMKNEEEAMNMYLNLAKTCSNIQQKELFAELAKMEEMHKVKLEEIYTNAAYAEVW